MRHNKFFISILLLEWMYFVSQTAMANFDLWNIQEIYSNEDGTIQFIELSSSSDNQESLSGVRLVSTDSNGTISNTFVFTSNSGTPTNNRHLLLATPGFAGLPNGITPDYEIPFSFLFTAGGTLNFGSGTDVLTYHALPTDGMNSLDRNGSSGANSPTNFAGETGHLVENSYAIFALTTGILRLPVVDVPNTGGNVMVFSAILQLMPGSTNTFELLSAVLSGRVASIPGFHDNPSYDTVTNVVILPFVAVDTGGGTQRWYAELEYLPSTNPMQFRLIPPDPTTNIHHYHSTIEIFVELNMQDPSVWANVPLQANRNGRVHTLETIYREAGIDLIALQNAPVADLRTGNRVGQPYNEAELLQFQRTYMANPPPPMAGGRWHLHGAFLPAFRTSGTTGIMFTNNCCGSITPVAEVRTGFAVFVDTIASMHGNVLPVEGYLRTTAHELGHALNLLHEDGDGSQTIMTQTLNLQPIWDYRWSDRSFTHFNHHPLERIQPSTAFDFATCHDQNGNVLP